MAFVGPATSGFTTASIVQSAITTTANHMVEKTTGKSITEHVIISLNDKNMKFGYIQKVKTVSTKINYLTKK